MKVAVKLFAGARQLVGQTEVEVEIMEDSPLSALREALHEQHPALRPLLPHALFALNANYATDDMRVPHDAEIACIPPVSGG